MHPFFQKIAADPSLVNQYAQKHPEAREQPPFAEVFRYIINHNGNTKSIFSYLLITDTFDFHQYKVPIHFSTLTSVRALFRQINLDPELPENYNIFKFWIYLYKMYWLDGLYGCTKFGPRWRDEKIFSFFHDFPLDTLKIVILANEPSPNCTSSGKAFHLSPSNSTTNILKFLKKEMQLIENCQHDGVPLVPPQQQFGDDNTSSLQGWINQGILLLNSRLSRGNRQWEVYTDHLISFISRNSLHVVFILLGGVAADKLHLINQNNHCVINVYHPSHPCCNENEYRVPDASLDWNVILPFINANFYLCQMSKTLIDWTDTFGNVDGTPSRLNKLQTFYRFLQVAWSEKPLNQRHIYVKDTYGNYIFQMKLLNNRYLTLCRYISWNNNF